MKYKFVKPFSSFPYCLDSKNSTKDMWKMALRDPAYLFWIAMIIGMFTFSLIILL